MERMGGTNVTIGRSIALTVALMLALGSCSSGQEGAGSSVSSITPSQHDSAAPVRDIFTVVEPISRVQPGRYYMDPDLDASTPLRVVFDIPSTGWSNWIGAVKFGPNDGHVGVSITTVANLVTDGCRDHTWADPPIGPSVNDLANALVDLAPFRVTSPPEPVSAYGYEGMHLELTVPKMQMSHSGTFTGCDEGTLKSWVAAIDTEEPGDAFYGYTGPGYVEDFWILDVEGTRVMIAAERSAGSPTRDLQEQRAVLDSIRIET
jgi:hypothetical protein